VRRSKTRWNRNQPGQAAGHAVWVVGYMCGTGNRKKGQKKKERRTQRKREKEKGHGGSEGPAARNERGDNTGGSKGKERTFRKAVPRKEAGGGKRRRSPTWSGAQKGGKRGRRVNNGEGRPTPLIGCRRGAQVMQKGQGMVKQGRSWGEAKSVVGGGLRKP